ncbi:MAG TPA: hypothetical protein VG818_13505 [Gemmatimonadaceae bacterium]|nr:hypothetical protein [Gemmatimonadaceae bacterium]
MRQRTAAASVTRALLIALLASGCQWFSRGTTPQAPPVSLVVHNYGFFDVNVFALQTDAGPALRLGTVTGLSSAELTVRSTMLRPGRILVVQVHAIGTQYTWTSPAVGVNEGELARLDVYTDPDGNMSRSTLYTFGEMTLPRDTTADTTSAARLPLAPLRPGARPR